MPNSHKQPMEAEIPFLPIILAGGSGTRFWPRSRRSMAKQVLVLDGERSMIQQTADRLAPLARAENLWVITNNLLSERISEQLRSLLGDHIICEPAARNTAPAAGLAAFIVERTAPEAVLGIFPSDQVVADTGSFRCGDPTRNCASLRRRKYRRSWGSSRPGLKPATAISKAERSWTGKQCESGALRKNPTGRKRKSLSRPETTTGIAAFFCGARVPSQMPFASIYPIPRRFLRR